MMNLWEALFRQSLKYANEHAGNRKNNINRELCMAATSLNFHVIPVRSSAGIYGFNG